MLAVGFRHKRRGHGKMGFVEELLLPSCFVGLINLLFFGVGRFGSFLLFIFLGNPGFDSRCSLINVLEVAMLNFDVPLFAKLISKNFLTDCATYFVR